MEDVLKILLDIGLGGIALHLSLELRKLCAGLSGKVTSLQDRVDDHEVRIMKLEG